jgi:hypothetical protein
MDFAITDLFTIGEDYMSFFYRGLCHFTDTTTEDLTRWETVDIPYRLDNHTAQF